MPDVNFVFLGQAVTIKQAGVFFEVFINGNYYSNHDDLDKAIKDTIAQLSTNAITG